MLGEQMGTAQELAERIQRGHAESLQAGLAAPTAFYGHEVESLHLPPHDTDGVRLGSELGQLSVRESAKLRTTMPDAALTELVVTVLSDSEVEMTAVMRGTTADGTTLAHPFRVVYSLRDGQIVKAVAGYDPEPLAALHKDVFDDFVNDQS
jgi:hypothetical protein